MVLRDASASKNIPLMILPVQEDWRIVVGHEIPEIKSTQTNILGFCAYGIFAPCHGGDEGDYDSPAHHYNEDRGSH